MKMKIKCCLLAFLLLGSSVITNAGNGLKRSEWDFGPEIALSNLLYALALGEGTHFLIYDGGRPFWAPNFIYKQYINNPGFLFSMGTYDRNQKRRIGRLEGGVNFPKWYDPNFKNLSVGYGVNFMSKEYPFGFSAKLAYEQVGWDVAMRNEDGNIGDFEFKKQMIVPEILLKLRFGSYRRWNMLFCLELGASYDYAINAKCYTYSGKETVNNGVTGIVGISLGGPESHLQAGANFYMPTYMFYNRDYTPDGGLTHPFDVKYHPTQAWSMYLRYGF